MKRAIAFFLAACASLAAGASKLDCSVKATRLDADTRSQAKVAEPDARRTALAEVKTQGAQVASGGLEVEDGCLLYTYDVKVPGKKGVQEVVIDAASGKVLRVEHESATKEAAEKLADKLPKKN